LRSARRSTRALEVPPPPTQWATDRAGLLSPTELDLLNAKLRDFEQASGAQFFIYVFPSLEGEPVEDFTIRCAEAWKVGQKKYDNGLILFVFAREKIIRVEVGYGLEGAVTDAISSRAIREYIAPHFSGDCRGIERGRGLSHRDDPQDRAARASAAAARLGAQQTESDSTRSRSSSSSSSFSSSSCRCSRAGAAGAEAASFRSSSPAAALRSAAEAEDSAAEASAVVEALPAAVVAVLAAAARQEAGDEAEGFSRRARS
jgi:hypothetical protein